MHSSPANHQPLDTATPIFGASSSFIDVDESISTTPADLPSTAIEPIEFQGHYAGCMEMNADARTVADYLDVHQDWFHRCARPMQVESIATNGYALVIGRFGSFGYEVEPKVGLHLLPQDQGVYRIQTIPVPGYEPQGYDVDFQAALELHEEAVTAAAGVTTRVEWELNLKVLIQFPRFIHALPKPLIQSTGDRLLNQIVRQVSRRLTHKVQEDFHTTQGISMPTQPKKRYPWHRHPEISIVEEIND